MACAMGKKICVYQGDGLSRKVIYSINSEVQDIAGYSADFMVKSSLSDADADAVITKSMTIVLPSTDGTFALALVGADTDITPGEYYYGIKITPTGGEPITIQGRFVVADRVQD